MREELTSAIISSCRRYRYDLERRWADGLPLVWVMLNPSTADASADDPTIRRVRGFTKRLGYPAFRAVNLWALRATDPRELHRSRSEFESRNICHIQDSVMDRNVIAAWGANVKPGRCLEMVTVAIESLAKSAHCFGRTKDGHPRHPLMLRSDAPLEAWP